MAQVWCDSEALNALRKRTEISLESFPECQGCPYIALCTGNCPGTALSLLCEANRPSPEGCLQRFKDQLGEERLW